MPKSNTPKISVVVPVFNEAENVGKLVSEIASALSETPYEMIFVDDASTDDTLTTLKALKAKYPTLRALSHRKNAGQSRSVRTGILAAMMGTDRMIRRIFRRSMIASHAKMRLETSRLWAENAPSGRTARPRNSPLNSAMVCARNC